MKPVTDITATANKLSIEDLSIRLISPKTKDEIAQLCHTINTMLDRVETAVIRLKRFTGDVSHELRTPLAVIQGESELALNKERSPR